MESVKKKFLVWACNTVVGKTGACVFS